MAMDWFGSDLAYETSSASVGIELRRAAKNVTYMWLNSMYTNSNYNANKDNAPIIQGSKTENFPWWIPTLVTIDVVAMAACITWAVFSFLPERKKKEEAEVKE